MKHKLSKNLTIGTYTLKEHGAGPLYEIFANIGKVSVRLGVGAYGNIAQNKGGNFSWFPRVKHYRGVAWHLFFLNACFSFIYVRL
jgi:hypothetical protein